MSKNKPNNVSKSYKDRFYIQGMHCSSCEILIKQDVLDLDGVVNAHVSLSKSHIIIHADNKSNIPNIDTLNEKFKDLGYSFHKNKDSSDSLVKQDIIKVVGIALLFLLAFYLLEKSGIFMRVSISSQSSVFSYFVFGLAAGVSSCAALVGGLLLSLSKQWNELYNNNAKQSILPFIYFNLSRIITFALLGGLLGLVGSFIKVSILLTSILAIVISILMLIIGFQMVGVKWFNRFNFNFIKGNSYLDKNKEMQGKFVPIIVGALTFFIPCGFTLIAQTNVLTAGSFYLGSIKLLGFALGTLPILAIISFSSVKFYSNPIFSKKFSLFAGIIIVFFGFYNLNAQLNVLGLSSLNDLKSRKTSDTSQILSKTSKTDLQIMKMKASGFDYYPKEITIYSGVKTRWDIYEDKALGCAKAVYARGLYPDVIYLKPGNNSVEFVAPAPGTYKISCSMGMVSPVIVKVI